MKISREIILKWMEEKSTRTVYSAAIEFEISPNEIWNILNDKDSDKCKEK